ncbi:MAG: pseudouridine synthase [Synechocystis sp.]|nr:pseudouridine synthase [Synechocystis sp.]
MESVPETILFYKPYGVLCQFTDECDPPRPTLKDFIDLPGLYPIGRLDRDSEGLLVLTRNNRLKYRLGDRRFAHPRTYWVQVEGDPCDRDLAPLRQGIQIRDYRTRPAIVQVLPQEPVLPPRHPPIRFRQSIPTRWLAMTLTEGRNRQVRHMTAVVGFPTLRLVRIAIASPDPPRHPPRWQLTLDGLEPGQWRSITATEQGLLQQLAGR